MIVEVSNVSLTRDASHLLRDINWSIKKDEHWAILGLNGSGKTLLLNMLNGYIFPTKGQVTVLGKTLGHDDVRELRKSIGWVSSSIQEKLYSSERAIDIVLSGKFASIGLYEEASNEDILLAKNLLKKLYSDHLSNRVYQTLSQGEKQRILIARGLMAQPDLLILDEPCTGLDIFAKERLLEIVEQLSEDINPPTLIYVTHQVEEILPAFSHSLLLKKGEVYDIGLTEKILTSDNISRFFGVPMECKSLNGRYRAYRL